MTRKNHINQWQEPVIGLDVPRLPFLTRADQVPACTAYQETFARAGDIDRLAVATPSARRRTEHAETTARAVCYGCPVLRGCRRYALDTRQRWGMWGATTAMEREQWAKRQAKKRGTDMGDEYDDIPTIPLFDAAHMRITPDRTAGPKSVAQGKCPNCLREKLGVLPTGAHWVWRTHYYKTWGGDTRVCSASGVALCVAPEPAGKELTPGRPIMCPHGSEPEQVAA